MLEKKRVSSNITTSFTRIILTLILGVSFVRAFAQDDLIVELNPTTANVGDYLELRLIAPGAKPEEVTWFPIAQTLGDFTVLKVDTVRDKRLKEFGGAALLLTLAAYDTGSFSTGDFEVSTSKGILKAEGVSAIITTVLTDSTTTDLRPFKAQEELPITLMDVIRWTWMYALGVVVLIALYLLYCRWLKTRRGYFAGIVDEEPPIPPYEEAIQALARLKEENPLRDGNLKAYVSALSEITKRLLERIHHDPVLEMTTYEVKHWINECKQFLAKEEDLVNILDDGDRVKFAKGVIGPERCEELYDFAKQIVESYHPDKTAHLFAEEEQRKLAESAETEVALEENPTPSVLDVGGKR